MALIVITLSDSADGNIELGMQSEPSFGHGMIIPASAMSAAQRLCVKMLNLAQQEEQKKEQPLIQLN